MPDPTGTAGPEQPLTRGGARAWAVAVAARRGVDASEVSEVVVDGYADDPAGGYAFRFGRLLLVAGRDGSHAVRVDPGDEPGRRDVVLRAWERSARDPVPVPPRHLGAHQRAALAALRLGVRRVAAVPVQQRPGVGLVELPGAEWILMMLRQFHPLGAPTVLQAAAHLEEAEALRRVPAPDPPIHPCPVCRGVAPWSRAHPRTVCRDCARTTRCDHGRLVEGRVDAGATLVATHQDDGSTCEDTTAGGAVSVAAWPAVLTATRSGGVVVQASPRPVNAADDLAMLAAARDLTELLTEVTGLAAPPLPAWTAGPFDDGDAEEHLWRLAEHLVDEVADAWSADHRTADPDAVRRAVAHLLDPSLA
ncbi:hypothetical protein [uncultured Nocardioides sp.]|uniref:hypothetical protein n=1 Tax=uncultured Nocardioides sp. TaxID=198441 RepID=UPI00263777E4|nr:hypothetical protein [uncultured Nocardioides sp.]